MERIKNILADEMNTPNVFSRTRPNRGYVVRVSAVYEKCAWFPVHAVIWIILNHVSGIVAIIASEHSDNEAPSRW